MSDEHELLKILRGGKKTPSPFRLGTIPTGYTSGWPTIQFDGEGTIGTRTYPCMAWYTPSAGDKVLLARVGNGFIILGKYV